MLVKYYNYWTTHEAYYEFPKGTNKKKRLRHFKKWLIKDAELPAISEDYPIQDYKNDTEDLLTSGEMTIIKPRKIK
ncbi:MAG: hypothetical protein ACXAC5_04930 [Promethearchaeota archaeon]|jgi:hypothetical protein